VWHEGSNFTIGPPNFFGENIKLPKKRMKLPKKRIKLPKTPNNIKMPKKEKTKR
jgi:hypothetical protein